MRWQNEVVNFPCVHTLCAHMGTCEHLRVGSCLGEKNLEGVRENKQRKRGKRTIHAVCESLWGKDGETEGARGRFDEVEVVYLACTLPLAGWAHIGQTGRQRYRQEGADLRYTTMNSSRRKIINRCDSPAQHFSLERAADKTGNLVAHEWNSWAGNQIKHAAHLVEEFNKAREVCCVIKWYTAKNKAENGKCQKEKT